MENLNTHIKMNEYRIYQPWSAPILHFKLPEKILEELLKLTDLIIEDNDKVPYGDKLAGEIEEEWKIDPILLSNIQFKDYLKFLCFQYLKVMISQYDIVSEEKRKINKIPPALNVLKSKIDGEIEIISAWFLDQKDNEYNPLHNHSGLLSGVLYLKIPEYLPSRKSLSDIDGTIMFIGNENSDEGIITSSKVFLWPKVGDIFLFPSSLKHQVYPFRTIDGKGIRRSMSFNIIDQETIKQFAGNNYFAGSNNSPI